MQLSQETHRQIFTAVVLICIICCKNHECTGRVKRKVVFSKNSKLFFRLNGKANVIPWNQIFALGWAIRVNYDLPENIPKRHKFFKRDIHADIEDIPNESARQGFSCVARYLCESVELVKSSKNCGMFCEIGKLISRSSGVESDFFNAFLDKCEYHTTNCPLSYHSSLPFISF